MEWTGQVWRPVPDERVAKIASDALREEYAARIAATAGRDQVKALGVLRQFGAEGADAQSIAIATDRSRIAARKTLEALVADGKALRKVVVTDGGRGKRVLYIART